MEPVLDDLKRHIELGLEAEALEICKGMVLGLYRLNERVRGDVLGWGADEQKSRDIPRKTRLRFLETSLAWGILKETK